MVRRSVHWIEVHRRVHRRHLGAVLYVELDRLVAQFVHKVRFPIPLESWWVQRIEHALQRRVRDGTNEVQGWREFLPDRFERFLGLLHRPGVAPHHPAHVLAVKRFGEGRPWRNYQESEEAVDVIGCLGDEPPIPLYYLRCLVQLPQHGAAIDGMDRVSLEHERGDDAEVSATAAQSPEQIRMMLLVGCHKAAVCQYDVGGDQVVAREAAFAGQVPQPSAQGESAHAGRGNDPAGYRQAKGVGSVIDVAPGAASSDPDGPRFGIDARITDEREIDDQSVIADPQPASIVPAAPDGNEETVLAAKVDRRNDVGHIGAARDQGGALVDHTIVDLACSIVTLITGLDELSPAAVL